MKGLSDAEDRRLAVTTFDKNVVVTAGAGTGKTTLLVERILHLLMREPDPLKITDIVALTFTNKAANEMKIRLKERLLGFISAPLLPEGRQYDEDPFLQDLRERYSLSREKIEARAHDAANDLEMAQIGTVHSFAGHILRLYPIEARMDPKFQEDDGSEFEAHFEREWEGWLDVELSSGSLRRGLWKMALHSIGLESLESFAKELCRENIPVPRLLLYFDNQAQSHAVERWLREMRERAERLLSVYTKERKVEHLLRESCDLFDQILSKNKPDVVIEGTLGSPPSGWSDEDFREAKQIIRAAKGISSADAPFFRDLLELLLPFVTETRRRFTASGYISFDGLLTSCRELLMTHLRVREELKQRFKAILVDEFQDTDPIQYEIILYLSEIPGRHEAEWHKIQLTPGKLFIVGDPKQSIYAFRRADIEAYSSVVEMIIAEQEGIQASLSTNFRSHDRIIDVVNDLSGRLIQRRELLQPEYIPLIEHPEHKAGLSGQRVELRIVDGRGPREEDMDASKATRCEAEAIGRWLKEEVIGKETLLDSKGAKTIVSPRHVALLFRKLTEVYEYLEVLRRYEIPYIVEGERHFFGTQEVIDFVNLLKSIDNPFDRVAFVGVLRSPLGGLSDREIYELGMGETELCRILRRLHHEAGAMPLTDAIHHIFESLPVLEFAASSYQGEQAAANLMKIQRIAESLSARSNLTLKGFTSLLETKVTGLEKEGESPLSEETVDAVRLLSIHKAKGLEFPLVILAGMHSSLKEGEDQVSVIHDWSRDEIGFKVEGFRNPAAVMLQERRLLRDEEEQKRLLYVAMTRARECLVLSGTLYGRVNRGSFLSLATEGMGDAVGERSVREIETGKGGIRQSVIAAADCIPDHSSKKGRGSEARKGRSGDVASEEIAAFADLWESRDQRYAAIRSKALFVTPSGLKEAEEAEPALKKTEATEGDRAARERAILIGTIAHAVLEHWDFGKDPALFKEAINNACLKFIPIGSVNETPMSHRPKKEHENPPPLMGGGEGEGEQRVLAPLPLVPSHEGRGNKERGFSSEPSSIIAELYEIFDAFSTSPAYDELRRATIIGREVPFVIPWGEQVMNGVIDLIYREGDRLYVVDYKTDKISEGEVADRVRGYSLSGEIYMEAVRRSLRQEVSGFKLIFLRLGRGIDLTAGAG